MYTVDIDKSGGENCEFASENIMSKVFKLYSFTGYYYDYYYYHYYYDGF